METVGIFLKKEREANNISLSELARKTKITPIYLELIEKNEFDKIPQGPYIKGYLSSYSQAVGCDADKAIALYTSGSRERPQAEGRPPGTASITIGTKSADAREAAGRPDSRFHHLVSSVATRCASIKAAEKTSGVPSSSETPRRLAGLGPLGIISNRWSTGRGTWLYAGMALLGACVLFLAGAGFYHLFLYNPRSPSVIAAETTLDKEEPLPPAVASKPSGLASSPVDASTEAPTDYFTSDQHSESAGFDAAVHRSRPERNGSSGISSPAESNGRTSPAIPASPPQAPMPRQRTVAENGGTSGQQATRHVPPPPPDAVDASLKVSKAAICRAIEDRMPAGVDRSFPTSDGKIYVWTQIEARQVPSRIRHIYYFGGKKVNEVSLDIRSSNWRTWSVKTIADGRDRGQWRVDIATAAGQVLRRLHYEVK